jgi:hypothetical protein
MLVKLKMRSLKMKIKLERRSSMRCEKLKLDLGQRVVINKKVDYNLKVTMRREKKVKMEKMTMKVSIKMMKKMRKAIIISDILVFSILIHYSKNVLTQ